MARKRFEEKQHASPFISVLAIKYKSLLTNKTIFVNPNVITQIQTFGTCNALVGHRKSERDTNLTPL